VSGTRRFATLDIGTNTVLLLVADAAPGGLLPVLERATITRLGQGVDRTRELAPEARERTLACLRDYAQDLARLGVSRVAAVGTSALRDARGGAELVAEATRILGVAPSVIGGEREAELTFRGALSGLEVSGPVTVFDVGGGSTEVVTGDAEHVITSAVSHDIGSVRLYERHVATDPPSAAELARVREDIDRTLATRAAPPPGTLVGVAGTVTTLAAIALELGDYDPSRVHGQILNIATVRSLFERLATLPLEERKTIKGLEPARADVIVVGAAIVERVMHVTQSDALVVSDRGVRWGLLEELANARGAT
jgi:exopolyphosphatase/guanosine-5'-triphosphate,3'-diphosphate pyrophosphatase